MIHSLVTVKASTCLTPNGVRRSLSSTRRWYGCWPLGAGVRLCEGPGTTSWSLVAFPARPSIRLMASSRGMALAAAEARRRRWLQHPRSRDDHSRMQPCDIEGNSPRRVRVLRPLHPLSAQVLANHDDNEKACDAHSARRWLRHGSACAQQMPVSDTVMLIVIGRVRQVEIRETRCSFTSPKCSMAVRSPKASTTICCVRGHTNESPTGRCHR